MFYTFFKTQEEREETLEFLENLKNNFNIPLIYLEYTPTKPWYKEVTFETLSRKGEPFESLIDKRKFLPNIQMRFCTQELKIKTCKRYLRKQGWKKWYSCIGIRADEPKRVDTIKKRIELEKNKKVISEIPLLPLLENAVTSLQVKSFWSKQSFDLQLPIMENGKTIGGNCIGCFMHSEYDRARVARVEPDKFQWLIDMEEKVGGTFDKKFSCKQLQNNANKQPMEFFNDDSDFFCTTSYGGCNEF